MAFVSNFFVMRHIDGGSQHVIKPCAGLIIWKFTFSILLGMNLKPFSRLINRRPGAKSRCSFRFKPARQTPPDRMTFDLWMDDEWQLNFVTLARRERKNSTENLHKLNIYCGMARETPFNHSKWASLCSHRVTREPAAAVVASADVIDKAKWRLKAARAEHFPMVTACLIILCNYKNRSA